MKKMLAVLLALLLMLGVFAACSKNEEPEDAAKTDASQSEPAGDQSSAEPTEPAETQAEPGTDEAQTSETAGEEDGDAADHVISFTITPPSISFDIPTYVAPEFHLDDIHIEPIEIHLDIKPFTYEGRTIDMSDFKINTIDFDGLKVFVPEDSQIDLEGIDAARMQEIVEKEASLLQKLTAALNGSGLNVKTDTETGEVSLDASVLFGGDSSALSDAGKAFLREFGKAYTEVLLDKEFEGFLAEIRVEGHCAPVAGDTYETAFPLSQERAEVVRDYLLSDECGLDAAGRSALQKLLTAQGLSNLYPVKNAAGQVDMDASRRVAFRFLVNVE